MEGITGGDTGLGASQLVEREEKEVHGDDGVVTVRGDINSTTAADNRLRGDVVTSIDDSGARVFLDVRKEWKQYIFDKMIATDCMSMNRSPLHCILMS